ncbi:MAG: hypothetical protein EXR75_09000 [Myxococcales bacterium]|nr:hypothetical protein [Myxococcales bacterium]
MNGIFRSCGGFGRAVVAFALALGTLMATAGALAAPEAHILRIDPRASMDNGQPLLTTVVELVQNKRMTSISTQCAHVTGDANLDCISDALATPEALYTPLKFPEKNAILAVAVDGKDIPATFVSRKRWGESKAQEGIGTAWLVMIDAGASMGARFPEARAVARAFVTSMDPHDTVNIMFFNDTSVVKDSGWLNKKAEAAVFVDSVTKTFPDQGRTRQLFNIIKTGASDAFRELGNAGTLAVPMHQAMVVLSNGASGTDTGSPSQSALLVRDFMTKGRFPEENKTLPKAPVPIISVWFPMRETEELYQNAKLFMENLANVEMGGFFSIVRAGQGEKGARIVQAVRKRFDQMHIIRWRVPCVAPSIQQTFKLVFTGTDPVIAGDNFIDVPVGIDPTTWPLDIDYDQTVKAAQKNKLSPGGRARVFGSFCWGSDAKRAKLYLIPKNQELPESLKGKSVDEAKKAQQTLVASQLVGTSIDSGEGYVEFELPDNEKFLQLIDKKKKTYQARLVVYDTKLNRTSAVTAESILTLAAEKKPLNYILIGAATFGGVVVLLLLLNLLRGAGGGGRRGAPQRPMTPGPGIGGPGAPGGYPPPGYGPPR